MGGQLKGSFKRFSKQACLALRTTERGKTAAFATFQGFQPLATLQFSEVTTSVS